MKDYAGKILMIVQNLPVPFDRRVWLEAKTLTEHGYKVSVISPKGKNDSCYEVLDGVAIYRYRVPMNAEGFWGYVSEFVYCWIATFILSLKVLWREGFDAIHACNPPDTYFFLGLFYRIFGKQFIFDHHDLSPEMYLAKYKKASNLLYKILVFLEKMTFRTATVVLATNESHKRIAIERGKKKEDDVFIVRTGPDFDRLKVMQPENKLKEGRKHLVCYLGEMCPQDGVDYLLKSADYLVNDMGRKDVLFVLMGGGPAMPALRDLNAHMGLSDFVKFTGRVSDRELCRYLSTADVCVDPDPWSEWADKSTMNKMMEYMTFAKPIVAYDLTEGRYSAQDAALYVKPNDTKEFASKVSQLLVDQAKRAQMGQYGRQRVLQELAWEHTQTALVEAYERVYDGNGHNGKGNGRNGNGKASSDKKRFLNVAINRASKRAKKFGIADWGWWNLNRVMEKFSLAPA